MEEELREGHLDVKAPALPPGPEPQSEAEKSLIVRLGQWIRQLSIILKQDIIDYIDGLIEMPGSMKEKFMELARKVFPDGVTWETIILLLHVAGKMAVKVVEAKQPHLVIEIFKIVMNYFKETLLGWVARKGGWSPPPSEPSDRMPFNTNDALIGAGLAFLCIVVWKLIRVIA
ncbi:unnamed protein product [Boreogadus saida]